MPEKKKLHQEKGLDLQRVPHESSAEHQSVDTYEETTLVWRKDHQKGAGRTIPKGYTRLGILHFSNSQNGKTSEYVAGG